MRKKRWQDFKFRLRSVDVNDMDDRLLLLNLYLTQGVTLILSLLIFLFQWRNPLQLFRWTDWKDIFLYGGGLALAVLAADFLVSRWVPEEVTDDGGINELLFGKRPVGHIFLISFIVAVCEEMLFRGAIQAAWGPYWTSILFAGIHIRYLRSWIMTGMVFSISYGLGTIYDVSGTIWTPIFAHFLIDLTMGLILRFGREKG